MLSFFYIVKWQDYENWGNRMVFVQMTQQDLNSMEDERLAWTCIEPALMEVRGKSETVKAAVVQRLHAAQRAIFMFRVMYDHAKGSAGEYYGWLSILKKTGRLLVWRHKRFAIFFEDTEMQEHLEESIRVIEVQNRRKGRQWEDNVLTDLDREPELKRGMEQQYGLFKKLADASIARIAAYIRRSPELFIQLEHADEKPLDGYR